MPRTGLSTATTTCLLGEVQQLDVSRETPRFLSQGVGTYSDFAQAWQAFAGNNYYPLSWAGPETTSASERLNTGRFMFHVKPLGE